MSVVVAVVAGLILSAISIALSELLAPKPEIENARPSNLGDFNFPTAVEGRVVPVVWGRVRLKGPNVVWYGDLTPIPITQRIRTSPFRKKRVTVGHQYNVGIQMVLCRGPIDSIKSIEIGDKNAFTGSTLSDISLNDLAFFGGSNGTGGILGTVRVFPGNETQAISTYLSTFQGATTTPAYRGNAYVILTNDTTSTSGGFLYGNSPNIKPMNFEVERIPDGLGLGASATINGADSNPANIFHELITNDDFGLGFPAGDIDTANFTTVGTTLKTEGQGFSFVLDRARPIGDIFREIERQIDGFLVIDASNGKFQINLARGGFDIDTVPQIDDTTLLEVKEFAPQGWEETINQIRIFFADRDRNYFETFSQAHNLANQRIQGSQIISATQKYPGVKDKTLATKIASREIKLLSRPLIKATVNVTRDLFAVRPGDVVAFTNADLKQTKLAIRVSRVDQGQLTSGQIEISGVEDVFDDTPAFFGEPESTLWVIPTSDVGGIPAGDQTIFELPKKFADIDPDFPAVIDRVWCGGRSQGNGEVTYKIFTRTAAGAPSGSFREDSENEQFLLIGDVRTELAIGDQDGTATLEVNGTPDSITLLIAEFTQNAAASDIGSNLINLIKVGNEFIGVTSATDQTTHVNMTSLYRGLMDTVPEKQTVGTDVFLMIGGATDSTFPRGNQVDVQLRPTSASDEATEGESTTINLTLADRARRPYPPAQMTLNTTLYDTTVDFDVKRPSTSGLDNQGIDVIYNRKDFRVMDEAAAISVDAATLFPDFPAENTTEYQGKIIEDPEGSPTTLETIAFADTKNIFFSRTKILRALAGVIPTDLKVEILARHTVASTVFNATEDLGFIFTLAASTLDNDFNWGNLDDAVISSTFTAPDTGTYNFSTGVNIPTGILEGRINGGSFSTIISAGTSTGTLAGVTATDTIEVRHTETGGSPAETFLECIPPSSSVGAYAILIF